jgi:ABC-type transporter Mla MlaB component
MSATLISTTSHDEDTLAGSVKVVARGPLDRSAASRFAAALDEQGADPDRLVIVDVSRVDVRDHAGLSALSSVRRMPAANNRRVFVSGLSAAAQAVMDADERLEALRSVHAAAA